MSDLNPITRREAFLAAAGGQDVTTPTPVTREEVFLDAIAKGGGGSSLPPVTSADNGKVLTVENGAWAADANTFVITASGTPRTIDKTVDEILAALDAGKAVYLVDGSKTYAYLGKDSSNIYFAVEYDGTNRYYVYIALSDATYSSVSYPKLPTAFASDNGSELIVKNSRWTKQKKKFIVTLTPTSPDYSGTMDKTPAEITAAYNAGQEIVFSIPSMNAQLTPVQFLETDDTIIASAHIIYNLGNGDVMIAVTTDASASTYGTSIYSLTPAS